MDAKAVEELDTTESIVTTGREETKKPSNWSELPSLPLENIYSFLDVFDRINMALVCHRWYEGYSSPSLWKTFKFTFTKKMMLMYNFHGMKFVQKYGRLFRHVEIYYHILSPYNWSGHFIVFLQKLANHSQLISIKIHNLDRFFLCVDTFTYGNVKTAIDCFLASQCHLKKVEFGPCFFDLQHYNELLKELNGNSRASATHFGLRGLRICDRKAIERDSAAEDSLLVFLGLPSLTTLAVDYSRIFENTFSCQSVAMKIIKKCKTRVKLSKIILDYKSWSFLHNFQGLTSADWQFLKKLYPDLKVELNFKPCIPSRSDVEFLIVPDMPIVWVNIIDDYDVAHNHSSFMKIDTLFARLTQCKISDHLQSLCFKLKTPILDLSFIPFLQACKKLEYFDLSVKYPAKGLEFVLKSWLENRPASLTKVFIEISGANDDNACRILEKLTTEYVPGLKLVGLNVKLSVKK